MITDAMRAVVGGQISRAVSYPVSESDIRRWAIAVYYPQEPPKRFWDQKWQGGMVAPEDFNPFAWMASSADGRPRRPGGDPDHTENALGIEGPGLTTVLNGGMSAEYGEPIRPGDVITSVNRLADYSERTGRLGHMLFTVLADTWTNQRDQFVKRTRMTLIRY
ncbi:MAG TPA: MaoC family dehydratase N-terminal domain-containing protein [Pseudonocardiaceae bacterium]